MKRVLYPTNWLFNAGVIGLLRLLKEMGMDVNKLFKVTLWVWILQIYGGWYYTRLYALYRSHSLHRSSRAQEMAYHGIVRAYF